MAASMFEMAAGASHTGFPTAPPLFRPMLVLSYGVNSADPHGVIEVAQVLSLSTGFSTEGKVGTTAAYSLVSNPVEESASGMESPAAGVPYYNIVEEAGSVYTGSQSISDYLCGEVDIVGGLPQEFLAAMFLAGGTLESAAGVVDASASGSHSVTGVGFQPDLVLVYSNGSDVFGITNSLGGQVKGICWGACDASMNQWSAANATGQLITGTGSRGGQMDDIHVGLTIKENPSGPGGYGYVLGSWSITSMDSDGFTYNVDNPTANKFAFVAIKDPGGHFTVGTGTAGDTTLTTGPSEALLFCSVGLTAFQAPAPGTSFTVGGATRSDGTELTGWIAGRDGADPVGQGQYWQTAAISTRVVTTGGPPTAVTDEAVIDSWGPSSVDLNWTIGGTSGIKFGWVSLKCSTLVGTGCGDEFLPQIYRWLKK